MRVPIPVVILLVLLVVSGVWWGSTWEKAFMTPPSEKRLEEIRTKTAAAFPRADGLENAISPLSPVPATLPVEEPAFDLGDLTPPPSLAAYRDLAPKGTDHLVELANRLEQAGQFQRALLAWERVIDSSKPDESQATAAIAAIKRLRPTLPDWNPDPAMATVVTLHAGTGRTLAKKLVPALEVIALELGQASAGIVKVKTNVKAGKTDVSSNGPTPVALWLAGSDKGATTTEVRSFTVNSPESLQPEILKTVFILVRSHIARSANFEPPADLGKDENPQDALNFRVTRLAWSEFAAALNKPPI